jgi:hypothetical protein
MTVLQAESVVLICQRALALAEEGRPITSLQDGSFSANQALMRYDFRRRSILERLDWAFARARVPGQAVVVAATPPDLPSAWARPPEALRIRAVRSPDANLRFQAEAHVFSEEAGAVQLVYTSDASNPSVFPPIFTTALEYLLAADFSMIFARSINRQAEFLSLLQNTLEEADQLEAFESPGGAAYAADAWTDAITGGGF